MNIDMPVARALVPMLGRSRYKGISGGRGSMKSYFFADAAIERMLQVPGTSVACIREYQKTLEYSVKRLVEQRLSSRGLFRAGVFVKQDRRIIGPGGGVMIFQGMQDHTADSIKSLEGFDIAYVEEAARFSRRSLDLLRPTFRETPRGPSELWFGWNPENKTDPVDELFRGAGGPPPDSLYCHVTFRDNPWFPDVLREEMLYDKRRDPDKFDHVWNGGYLQRSEARVFKNWCVEEFEAPDDARFYFGGDWGFSSDPTVLLRCFIQGNRLFIDFEAYRIKCPIVNIPALFAGTDTADPPRWPNPMGDEGIAGSTEWDIVADSARPETIDHLVSRGFRVRGARKGRDSVKEGVEFIQGYDVVIHPRCVHTIDEFTHYSFKIEKATDIVLPVLKDEKNHCIDSLRYALEDARRGDVKVW